MLHTMIYAMIYTASPPVSHAERRRHIFRRVSRCGDAGTFSPAGLPFWAPRADAGTFSDPLFGPP